jgi:hypothetical protein
MASAPSSRTRRDCPRLRGSMMAPMAAASAPSKVSDLQEKSTTAEGADVFGCADELEWLGVSLGSLCTSPGSGRHVETGTPRRNCPSALFYRASGRFESPPGAPLGLGAPRATRWSLLGASTAPWKLPISRANLRKAPRDAFLWAPLPELLPVTHALGLQRGRAGEVRLPAGAATWMQKRATRSR